MKLFVMIEEEQDRALYLLHKKTRVPMSVYIREALDNTNAFPGQHQPEKASVCPKVCPRLLAFPLSTSLQQSLSSR